MSEHFHVHGPHDHELEHAAIHGAQEQQTGRIAVVTAIVATVGAIFAYLGGETQSNAVLYKNNAAIKKTEAADQWGYYQAKGSKQNLAELGMVLAQGESQQKFTRDAGRYAQEKEQIKQRADALDKEAAQWDARSEEQLHEHHRWSQATTVLQISIALAAIALLTKRNWLRFAMYGVAGVGLALGGIAALHL